MQIFHEYTTWVYGVRVPKTGSLIFPCAKAPARSYSYLASVNHLANSEKLGNKTKQKTEETF